MWNGNTSEHFSRTQFQQMVETKPSLIIYPNNIFASHVSEEWKENVKLNSVFFVFIIKKRNSSFRLNSTEMPNDEKCGKKLSLCNPRPLLIYLQKLFFLEIKEEERVGGEKETTKTRTVYLEVQFLKRPK